jgi:hypothetical protein
VSRIILRAVIAPPAISSIPGSSPHLDYAKGTPILKFNKLFVWKQLDVERGFRREWVQHRFESVQLACQAGLAMRIARERRSLVRTEGEAELA